MADQLAVPRIVNGADDDLVQVGRPVVYPKVRALADMVHHIASFRRKGSFMSVYQVDQYSLMIRGATANQEWQWRYTAGINTTSVWCRALVTGSVGGSAADEGWLTFATDEETKTFARTAEGVAAGSTIGTAIQHEMTADVTPGTLESLVVDQGDSANCIRVLGLAVDELPNDIVPKSANVVIDLDKFTPGQKIIDTAYDDLPLALHTMRRYCKKILHATCKVITTTTTASGTDIITNSNMNFLSWRVFPCIVRPESTGVAVTCYVRAATTSASNATFRFHFGSVNVDITVNSATPAWYSATGTITKTIDTVSLQAWGLSAGTFTLYGAVVDQTDETA